MTEKLAKTYDPGAMEEKWYGFWEQNGFFNADINGDKPAYCITIPPPNVTGELHMGHAIQHAIHDLVVRWKRMQGYETLCLAGTDHAGIATQMKVEQELIETEGKNRYDVGREVMLERIWRWKEKYGDAIYRQLRKLGASYDWRRERFTLDEDYVEAVLEAFARFQGHGWIYRGTRMINWCPQCRTVISDLETEERELAGHLWHIRYPANAGGPDVVVATTRPETMLGDTAVAVHPGDARWSQAIGLEVELPLIDRAIAIVADDYADPELGSGAVKVTPAHDPNDYEIGQRHQLEQIQVIGFDGVMTEAAGRFAGMDRYACRKAVVAALAEQGLLVKIEDHQHAVPHHDKCGTVIEPLPMEQWFMDMKALAQKAKPVLERQEINYVPDRFRHYAIEWLDNIRDWALSRQIWWGHRIPAWYCLGCSGDGLIPMGGLERDQALREGSFRVSVAAGAKPVVSVTQPQHCPDCGGVDWVQDPDVLDTWFSSALWPFATLGWPQRSEDLDYFYPTDLMITARDILYLWVLRMAMTSLECREQIPFKTVLVHPTILTKDGRRMSKSLGTGLNPLDLVDLYGADATRYSLLAQAGAVQDVRFDADIEDNKVQASASAEAGRNFANKLWNATRFVLMNIEGYQPGEYPRGELADRWIWSRLQVTVREITEHLETYRFSDLTRAIYDFVWRDYCDWYLELAKVRLQGDDKGARLAVQHSLVAVLDTALRLLHPIMPFITETLWQALPRAEAGQSIIVADWPIADDALVDAEAETQMQRLQEIVTAVRVIRGEMNVPPAKHIDVLIAVSSPEVAASLRDVEPYIALLSRAESVEIGLGLAQPPASGSAVTSAAEIFVPLEGLIDLEAERQRLEKEIAKFTGLLKGLEGKLANENFVSKAPAEVVARERQRQAEYRENFEKLQSSLQLITG
jgi:valyl-tRNA synthetase